MRFAIKTSPQDTTWADMHEAAKEFADAGLDLGIVYLPAPHSPSVLGPLAVALASLR